MKNKAIAEPGDKKIAKGNNTQVSISDFLLYLRLDLHPSVADDVHAEFNHLVRSLRYEAF